MGRKETAEAARLLRRRECQKCSGEFFPRQRQIRIGQGKFCSIACSSASVGICATPESRAKALVARADHGRPRSDRGESSTSWKGGRRAAIERRADKERAYRRQYREKNYEKCLEFTRKRRGKMTGRLPRGTVKRIGELQRWKCAACACDIALKYHIDHITALAKGGAHEPSNIQLLCPTCNVRKSAKDPIAFMQERGFLL